MQRAHVVSILKRAVVAGEGSSKLRCFFRGSPEPANAIRRKIDQLWKQAGALAPADRESTICGSSKSCNQQLVHIEGQHIISTAAASSMPDPHVLQGPAMKSVHVCFLLSVSLVAASLQLLIYTESAVCEAVSAEGDAFQTILRKMNYSYTYNTTDPCAWGPPVVQCNLSTRSITGLNFSNMGLSGPIPQEIGLFPSLQTLDFSNYPTNSQSCTGPCNSVLGPIPKELGNLADLQILLLSRSTFSQPFPPPVLNLLNLIELKMDICSLSGPIPPEISNLSKLKILFLGNNSLVGPLPGLDSLINLQQLTLWGNGISDKIPPQWGNLGNLTYLNLHDNLLWGPLPPDLGNLSKLTRMLIYGNDLTGSIPDSWKGLTSVSELNIRQNYLSDPFPAWIVSLPSLKTLDINHNLFTGTIPGFNESASLLNAYDGNTQNVDFGCNYFNGSQPTNLPPNVNITQNCFTGYTKASDSCQRTFPCRTIFKNFEGNCPPCPNNFILYNSSACLCQPSDLGSTKSRLPVGAVVGGLIGGLALSLALVALYLFKPIDVFDPFAKRKNNYGPWEIPSGVQKYTFSELAKATGNFSEANEIGAGGFGKVFKGTLDDGKMVAIKRASQQSLQGTTEFRNEVLLLSRLHHRHLVRLEGFCDDKGLQILVYEFMSNGNLHDRLLDSEKGKPLSWFTRLEVAVGVAQALDYLHSYADPPVIHRDIKPTNILLDDHFIAKVSDFGISKETPEFNTHVSTRPAGTAGYLDPEYFLRQQLTTASDVYAYGVVLLELITGQNAIDHMRFEEINLISWVKPRFKEIGVAGIVDPGMGEDYDPEILKVMTEVGLMSAASRKNDRPTMKEVLSLLEPHLKAFDPIALSLQAPRLSMKEEDSSNSYKPRHEISSDTGGSNFIEMSIPSSASRSHFNMTSTLLPR
ncbi:hypothetical protein BDL97_04G084700 [Sphagnum fallax]|nr:hypothetical protein BDL97_04G084700 [Sphagnum fallax]